MTWRDATDEAELVRTGQASPTELVEEAIEGVERRNPDLNAVIHPLFEEAQNQARALEEAPEDLPFRGVPFLLKDFSCYLAGAPVHEGMAALKAANYRADHDMWLTERFKAAGLVVLGRTNTPELGILPTTEPQAYGSTRNPWDLERSPGGSSGGSAAAVASGMVAAAHANDGGGSIRIPASHCGLVGLKPTRGRVTLGPDFGDLMSGLVCELAVTRSVRDSAALFDAIQGPGPGDPHTAPPLPRGLAEEVGAPPGRLRVGVLTRQPGGVPAHPDCAAAAETTGYLLESLGHHVEVAHPLELDNTTSVEHFMLRWAAGVDWKLKYWSEKLDRSLGPQDVEPCTWALAELARSSSGGDLLRAIEAGQRSSRRIAAWWTDDGFDILVTPTCAEPPPHLGEFEAQPGAGLEPLMRAVPFACFTAPFNVTGQPALSIPLHYDADGLPIGVQLVAAFGREDVLVQVGSQLEAAAPWAERHPGQRV